MRSYLEAVDGDLRIVRQVATSYFGRSEGAVLLTGSFAQGAPVYSRAQGELSLLSDLDIFVVTPAGLPAGGTRDLSQALANAGFSRSSVGSATFADLARRQGSQFLWELALSGIVLAGNYPDLLHAFASYVPDVLDARRLIVNRYAELGRRSVPLALKSIRAAVDAVLIVTGGLPALLAERLERARNLGLEWQHDYDLYARIIDAPILEDLIALDIDWLRCAQESLRRAASYVPDLDRLDGRDSWGAVIRHQRTLAKNGCFIPSLSVEASVHRRLAESLLRGRPPSRNVVRAWEVVHHAR